MQIGQARTMLFTKFQFAEAAICGELQGCQGGGTGDGKQLIYEHRWLHNSILLDATHII